MEPNSVNGSMQQNAASCSTAHHLLCKAREPSRLLLMCCADCAKSVQSLRPHIEPYLVTQTKTCIHMHGGISMTKSTLMSFLTGMVFFVMTWTTAMAHVSHIEPQAARNLATCVSPSGPGGVFDAQFCNDDTSMQTLPAGLDGSSPEEDFSFAHPFVMPKTFGADFSTHHDDDGEEPDHPTGAPTATVRVRRLRIILPVLPL